jgi:hypothetical protein
MQTVNNKEEELFQKAVTFLNTIGIQVVSKEMSGEAFLPGLSIEKGCIIIDKERLLYPGDILHEAGHIAVVPAAERNTLTADSIAKRKDREAEEMMAIAWSYAACVHLGFDPHLVFHDEGYKGGGSYIADNFANKQYFGLPMLQWVGLTLDEKNAIDKGLLPYPAMIKWLRD